MNLTQLEIDKLQHLLGDEFLLKIIEKVFDSTLNRNLPEVKWIDTNNIIGQRYRAYDQAKGLIRAAFLDLLSYKKEPEITERSFKKSR